MKQISACMIPSKGSGARVHALIQFVNASCAWHNGQGRRLVRTAPANSRQHFSLIMLRYLLIALMLWSVPFAQAGMIMSCSMMGGEQVRHCCCDDDVRPQPPCDREDAGPSQRRCCQLELEKGQADAVAEFAAGSGVLKNAFSSSPDIAPPLLSMIKLYARALRPQPPWASRHMNAVSAGRDIYLRTARLRI